MRRRQLIASAAALSVLPAARAQDRVIRIIVPFSPGGSADLIPRLIAPAIAEILGQIVIVENRAGAGGSIGASATAKAAPDGSTFGVATVSTHGIYPAVMKRVPYDPLRDFAPVTNLARVPNVVSVHPSLGVDSVAELVRLARDPRSKLDYGTPGVGSLGHMMGELFKQRTGSFMTHIPYRGAGPALQDAIGGQVQVLFDNLPASLPHIKSGRLRALAVAWPARHPQLPAVPTFAEADVGVLNGPAWFGIVAPTGTPAASIQRFQQAAAEVLSRPSIRARVEEMGAVAIGGTSASFGQELRDELSKWQQVARNGHIALESQ